VFSTINNLGDISILPQYAEICGYTERELIANFTPHLEVLAKKENLSVDKLVEKLRYRYDGFSFDGNVRLYNPFSMLHVLRDQQFDDFWIDTGMSETLVNYVKDKHLTVEEFRNFPYSRSQARNPGEMDSAPPESFLYQSGYLTLRKGTGEDFVLDYPNTEVLNAMSALVSRCLIGDREANNISNFLKKGFETGDKESLVGAFSKIIAGVPYDDYTKAAECEMFCVNPKMGPREWLYRTSLLCFLRGAGMWVDAEVHSSHGRSDIVARNASGKTLVVEIKIAQNATDVPAKLAEALAQIETRHYAAQFPNAQTLALVIDDEKRQVGAWG